MALYPMTIEPLVIENDSETPIIMTRQLAFPCRDTPVISTRRSAIVRLIRSTSKIKGSYVYVDESFACAVC